MSEPIKIVVDVGASMIKAIAKVGESPPVFLDMPPYCAKTSEEKCERLSRQHSDGLSVRSSWVKDIDGYYLLGDHARNYAASEIGINERKNNRAQYQVLGMIGAFAVQLGLPKLSTIKLCVLLPISEYASSEQFVSDLKIAISDFRYNGQNFAFKLSGITTKPEGAGTMLRGFPKSVDARGRIASMMCGYRNFSAIVLDGGKPDLSSSRSFPTGFVWVVNEISRDTGITDTERILENLVAGFGGQDCDHEIFEAAKENLPLYWGEIENCLSSLRRVDHAIACGGTFDLLRDLVKEHKPAWYFPDGLHAEVKKLIPRHDSALAFRYIDPYAILKGM